MQAANAAADVAELLIAAGRFQEALQILESVINVVHALGQAEDNKALDTKGRFCLLNGVACEGLGQLPQALQVGFQ